MQPLGPLDFDLAFEVYRDQITALCEGGVDLLIIETIQDLREAKAAMLAAKTVTEVPMICQMSFVQEGKSMMGTGPDTAAVVLSSFGADLVGTNCGTGPQEMLDAVRAMARVTSLGISAQPNAGLPRFFEGRLMYLTTPEYTADFAQRFVEAGAKIVGGCCGTTPEHIKAIAEAVKGLVPVKRAGDGLTRLASRTSVYEIGTGTPVLIGSRLGCPSLSEAAVREGFQAAQDEAERQFEQGARVIALECGADSEKAGAIRRLVELVQSACPGALYLVGSEPGALEAALRAVEGRALVSLSRPVGVVIDSLLPLAKRYGAAVLVQTQAEASAEDTPEESLRAARRVIQAAEQLGLEKTGILVEPGSLFTDEGWVNEDTLRALRLLKSDLKVGTAIELKPGVPTGDVAVAALRRAFESGADVLIADPSSAEIQAALSGP
jgi:5-methyltetrahydrofolate--homocysteine methyltransferase